MSSSYKKSIIAVFSGNLASQFVSLAFMPLLTRIYSVDDFGCFSLYYGFVTVGSIVANLKFDYTIFTANDAATQKRNFAISILTNCVISLTIFLISIVVFLLSKFFSFLIVDVHYLVLVPLGMLFTSMFNTFVCWYSRNANFKSLAIKRFMLTISTLVMQGLFAVLSTDEFGMAYGSLLATTLVSVHIFFELYRLGALSLNVLSLSTVYNSFKAYRLMLKQSIAVDILSQILYQAPLFILGRYFTTADVGYYALSQRVMNVPVSLIGGSVSDVFRQQAIVQISKCDDCKLLFTKTMAFLSIISLPIFIIPILWYPSVFSYIFGEQWYAAGIYTQILALVYMLKMISHPLGYLFIIRGRLNIELNLHIFMILLISFYPLIKGFTESGPYEFIWYYSSVYILFYVVSLVYSFKLAGCKLNA